MGILLDKEAKRSLFEWHPLSARTVVARFKTTIRNVVMIYCYAPTAAAGEAEKQEFYMQLNEILRKQKKRNIIILEGDLNAKVGQENEGLERIMENMGWEREMKMDNCLWTSALDMTWS